jgi:hypothetical protein
VEDLLQRHGYASTDGERWAPPTATGAPGVRPIPGRQGLYQSDHASDPLQGTFDAWTAFVVLEHNGDQARAEAAFRPHYDQAVRDEFEIVDSGPADALPPAPRRLDWLTLPEVPPEPAFIIPGWLPLNAVTLFAAHGGTGKSYLSLDIGLCLATGRHPFLEGVAVPRVKVVLFSAEDDMSTLQWRLRRYMTIRGIEPHELAGWFLVLDAADASAVLFTAGERQVLGRTTATFRQLKAECADFGASLLIFDNASDAFDGPENERAKVRQFVRALKGIAPAVLLLSHVDAATSMADPADAKGYSGNTAWNNSVRSRWFMARVKDSDDVVLSLPKANYAKTGGEVLIRWSDSEKVFRVVSAREGRARAVDYRPHLLGLFLRVLDRGDVVSPATNASTSLFNRIKSLDDFPRGLKTQDVAREVEAWRQDGLAEVEQYRNASRKEAERLVLTALGRHMAREFLAADCELA